MEKIAKKGRKLVAVVVHAGTGHYCGECSHGEWNDIYRDYQGKPFLIYCEHATYAYSPKRQMPTCFADTKACERFVAGEKGGAK